MLNVIGWTIKVTVFAVVVIVASHVVRWKGETISDQVRAQLSHAETRIALPNAIAPVLKTEAPRHEIPRSERQKLRALIGELNRSEP